MKIRKNVNADLCTIELVGRLDTTTAPQLENELSGSLAGIKQLVLDLKQLEYISSAGLRVLLATQKQMNTQGEMKVINVNDEVYEVFEVTGFTGILTIEK